MSTAIIDSERAREERDAAVCLCYEQLWLDYKKIYCLSREEQDAAVCLCYEQLWLDYKKRYCL